MAMVRTCDRCQAVAVEDVTRTITVSRDAPATNPVGADVEVTLTIQSDQDLCETCLISALVQCVDARGSLDAMTTVLERRQKRRDAKASEGPR